MDKLFCEKVYEITKRIPKGKVAAYGQIAAMAGNPKAARAVGNLMKNNPNIPIIPCHRVVASDGRLAGYSGRGGIKMKREMLDAEGVVFAGDSVNMSKSRWK